MPDYFVPIDTTLYTDYHRNLVAKGVIIKLTMKYIEKHRKELLNKYKKFETFNEKFEVDDELLKTMREMADQRENRIQRRAIQQGSASYQDPTESTHCPRSMGYERIFPSNE